MADVLLGQAPSCTMSDHGNGNIRVTFARIDKIFAQLLGAVGMYVSNTTQTQVAEILSAPASVPEDDSYYYEIDVSFPDANWADTDRCTPQSNNALVHYPTMALLVTGAPADGTRVINWFVDTNNLETWREEPGRILHNWSFLGMAPRCGITHNCQSDWYRPGNTLDDDLLFENITFLGEPGNAGILDFISFAKGTADTVRVKRCAFFQPGIVGGDLGVRISAITGAVNFIFTDCLFDGCGYGIQVLLSAACTVKVVGCTFLNIMTRCIDGNNITAAVNSYFHGGVGRNFTFDHCATSDAQGDIVALRNTQLADLNMPKMTVAIGQEYELPLGSVFAGQGTPDADSLYDIRGDLRDAIAPTIGCNEGVAIGIEGGGGGAFGMMGMVG